jgi:hypothetical protein
MSPERPYCQVPEPPEPAREIRHLENLLRARPQVQGTVMPQYPAMSGTSRTPQAASAGGDSLPVPDGVSIMPAAASRYPESGFQDSTSRKPVPILDRCRSLRSRGARRWLRCPAAASATCWSGASTSAAASGGHGSHGFRRPARRPGIVTRWLRSRPARLARSRRRSATQMCREPSSATMARSGRGRGRAPTKPVLMACLS